ncbi:MAG: hypothetical protein M3450_06080 [Actinomycetota bacterium]|nr:hypothetical protein [Actinomycetota bacterium]
MRHAGSAPARLRAFLAVGLLVVLAACGSGDSPTIDVPESTPTTTASGGAAAPTTTAAAAAGTVLAFTVRGGSVVEGASRQRATLNQPVTIRVTSDVADEVHVHGYDKKVDVAPGRPAEVTFVANIPGVFEVEFERSRRLLFTLEVR